MRKDQPEKLPEDEPPEGGCVRLISNFSVAVDAAGYVEISIDGPTIEIAEPDAS